MNVHLPVPMSSKASSNEENVGNFIKEEERKKAKKREKGKEAIYGAVWVPAVPS